MEDKSIESNIRKCSTRINVRLRELLHGGQNVQQPDATLIYIPVLTYQGPANLKFLIKFNIRKVSNRISSVLWKMNIQLNFSRSIFPVVIQLPLANVGLTLDPRLITFRMILNAQTLD